MAGDWMKIELELPDKPEVHAIAGRLQIDSDAVVGKLIRVWQWFDKHTTNGNAHGVSFALADRITSVSGFGDAMAFVGWLEQQDKTLVMPKFERHTSASAKVRALTAKRVSKHAVKTNANPNANTNGVSVSLALPEKRREDMFTTSNEVVVDSKLPTCPQQEILKLYEEILPELPQPRMWDGARATALTARWKAVLSLLAKSDKPATQENALDYFRQVFLLVKKSDFLMGNKGEWTASLGWIVKAENFAKIIDGNYDQ